MEGPERRNSWQGGPTSLHTPREEQHKDGRVSREGGETAKTRTQKTEATEITAQEPSVPEVQADRRKQLWKEHSHVESAPETQGGASRGIALPLAPVLP